MVDAAAGEHSIEHWRWTVGRTNQNPVMANGIRAGSDGGSQAWIMEWVLRVGGQQATARRGDTDSGGGQQSGCDDTGRLPQQKPSERD